MADVSRSEAEPARPVPPAPPRLSLGETWRRLNFEQRTAAVGAILLVVSTFGPFSFVEVAIILTSAAVLFLLRKRAEGRRFHVPFGDGAVIAAAGAWAGFLIIVRLFDRPLGMGLLALVCAAILMLAGVRERAKRPPDDMPEEAETQPIAPDVAEAVRRDHDETQETSVLPAKVLPPATPPAKRPPPPARDRPPAQDPLPAEDQPPLWEDPPR